jgi:hypothetical protein
MISYSWIESQEDQVVEYDSDQSGMKLDSPAYDPVAQAEADAKAVKEMCEWVQRD